MSASSCILHTRRVSICICVGERAHVVLEKLPHRTAVLILATSFPVIQDTNTHATQQTPAATCFQHLLLSTPLKPQAHASKRGCARHKSCPAINFLVCATRLISTQTYSSTHYIQSLCPTFSASSASCLMTGISPDSPFWHLMNASLNLLAFSGFAKRKANNSFCCSTLPVSGSSLQSGVK